MGTMISLTAGILFDACQLDQLPYFGEPHMDLSHLHKLPQTSRDPSGPLVSHEHTCACALLNMDEHALHTQE